MITLEHADSHQSNKNLRAIIVSGNNEGAYIDIMINDICIKSYRFACINPNDKKLIALCKDLNKQLAQGNF